MNWISALGLTPPISLNDAALPYNSFRRRLDISTTKLCYHTRRLEKSNLGHILSSAGLFWVSHFSLGSRPLREVAFLLQIVLLIIAMTLADIGTAAASLFIIPNTLSKLCGSS